MSGDIFYVLRIRIKSDILILVSGSRAAEKAGDQTGIRARGYNHILLKGIRDMALPIIGVVFGPIIMLLASVFLLQHKGRKVLVIVSAILFLFTALNQLLLPLELLLISVPQILWKLLTLATAAALFLFAIRDKHYDISILAFIQILALILTEILISPNEPVTFLQFDAEGKLLLFAGAVIIAMILPLVLFHPKSPLLQQGMRTKSGVAGIFLWMAAFAGMLSARSVTALFLFAQWAYLGNLFLRKAFGEPKKRQLLPVLQQLVLTLWIVTSGFIYMHKGTPAISGLTEGGITAGLISALVILFVFTMGVLIPEKSLTENSCRWPVSVVGLSMTLFSLLVPFSVLLKFRALFLNLDHKLAAPAVFLGALLMAANAYHAACARSDEELVSHLLLFVSGWAVISVFSGLEGVFFTVGYVIAAAMTFAFLFACSSILHSGELPEAAELPYSPALLKFKSIIPLLFLLPPFTCALPGLVVMPMLVEYGLALLFAVIGLVLFMAVIIRWALPLLRARKNTAREGTPLTGVFKYLLPVFFIFVLAANLLSGPIYRYLQKHPQPKGNQSAVDLGTYVDLSGILLPSGLNAGMIFLGFSAVVLIVLVIVSGFRPGETSHEKPANAVIPYSLTAWLPAGIRIPLWIRAAWITTATLLVGVALSCLKG